MKIKFLIYVLLFVSNSCMSQNKQNILTIFQIDSLKSTIKRQTASINFLKKEIPNVLVKNAEAGNCNIILFEPFGLMYRIRSQKPISNNVIFLCIPAAFTSKTNQIVGLFIENGVEVNSVIDTTLNGICIISSDSLKITTTDILIPKMIAQTKQRNNSIFQQILLVNNSKIVDCKFFDQKVNLRRAIIQFDNFVCVGQSQKPITIREFQESLIKIGAKNALYLDMGTWSEGWYKNYNREKIVIGEKMTDTNRQTNWLIYENE